MKQAILLFLTTGFLMSNLPAQDLTARQTGGQKPFVLGVVDNIQSVELGENRLLNIYLPQGYALDTAISYPVIYLLDGSADEDFIHIAGIVQFLTMIGSMPKSIVVGIANVDRKRDFTFPTSIAKDKKDYPTTGHSAKFITFIEKELQPFVQHRYRTGNRTIIGQSLGGLLATEVLLKKPGLFDNYIIVSPSLWWDNETLLTAAPKFLNNQAGKNINVYLSVGNEGKQMEDDTKRLTSIVQAAGNGNLHISFLPLGEETHLTILHNSVYKGLLLLNAKQQDLKK